MSLDPKKVNVFNIYYINFSKVYEISMMINNVFLSSIQRENSKSFENTKSLSTNASITNALDNLTNIKSYIGLQSSEKKTNSSKMVESLDVKTTKSILLKQIDKRTKLTNDFSKCFEGDLVKVDNVRLQILNENNLREFKMFRSDAFKGLQVDGVDVNNLITSMLKDYSYLLYGKIPNSSEMIVIKIPMELETEFESNYNIDDITIGRVSIIGVFKGIVQEEHINKNTFNHLYDIGIKNQSEEDVEEEKVFTSAYQDKIVSFETSVMNRKFIFLDVIAIVQNVFFNEEVEEQPQKIHWYKKMFNLFKRRGN